MFTLRLIMFLALWFKCGSRLMPLKTKLHWDDWDVLFPKVRSGSDLNWISQVVTLNSWHTMSNKKNAWWLGTIFVSMCFNKNLVGVQASWCQRSWYGAIWSYPQVSKPILATLYPSLHLFLNEVRCTFQKFMGQLHSWNVTLKNRGPLKEEVSPGNHDLGVLQYVKFRGVTTNVPIDWHHVAINVWEYCDPWSMQ